MTAAVGDRVKIINNTFGTAGQQGRIISTSATLRHRPSGPLISIQFDNVFAGDHAFYRASDIAKI